MLKKLFISFIAIFSTVLILFPHAAYAQCQGTNEWWRPTYCEFAEKVSSDNTPASEIFGERYTYAQVNWIMNSLISFMGGAVAECAAKVQNVSDTGTEIVNCLQQRGVLGGINFGPALTLAGFIDVIQTEQPASGVNYLAQKVDNLGVVDVAHAQTGYGYSSALLPVQTLWTVSRNAAYALSILMIVGLAFMVMFRSKISPQAALTAQVAIPRIIIALILITFSYAIAGFLVDLGFLIQGLISGLFASSGLTTCFGAGCSGGLLPGQIFAQMQNGVANMFSYGVAFIVESFAGGGLLGRLVHLGIADTLGDLVLAIPDIIIGIVLLILLIVAMFRIFFTLLVNYVSFILLVVAWPIYILFASVTNGSPFSLVRRMVAHLAVFVSVGVLIMMAHFFFFGFGNGGSFITALLDAIGVNINSFNFQTDSVSQQTGNLPSGFGIGSNVAALGMLASLALMLSIPKMANAIKDQIISGRGQFGFSTFGEAVGAPGAAFIHAEKTRTDALVKNSGATTADRIQNTIYSLLSRK